MGDLVTYDEAMIQIREFILDSQARDRFEDVQGWSRWRTKIRFLPRARAKMEEMQVGHPWLLIQRRNDKEKISVEKVSE